MLETADFVELIHWIPNFLEIGPFTECVVLPIYSNGFVRMVNLPR